jgi:hypothetical protein
MDLARPHGPADPAGIRLRVPIPHRPRRRRALVGIDQQALHHRRRSQRPVLCTLPRSCTAQAVSELRRIGLSDYGSRFGNDVSSARLLRISPNGSIATQTAAGQSVRHVRREPTRSADLRSNRSPASTAPSFDGPAEPGCFSRTLARVPCRWCPATASGRRVPRRLNGHPPLSSISISRRPHSPGISRRAAISPSGGEKWRFRDWGDEAPAQALLSPTLGCRSAALQASRWRHNALWEPSRVRRRVRWQRCWTRHYSIRTTSMQSAWLGWRTACRNVVRSPGFRSGLRLSRQYVRSRFWSS